MKKADQVDITDLVARQGASKSSEREEPQLEGLANAKQQATESGQRRGNAGDAGQEAVRESPGTSGSGGAAGSSTDAQYIHYGQELAALFKDRGVHPVVIVGGRGSGKTTLLASLLRYSQFSAEASGSSTLMEDLYPTGSSIWERQLSWARQLVERTAPRLESSYAPPPTKTAEPFFVPIRFVRTNGESTALAFLESAGELYMLQEEGESPHKKFHNLLAGFLTSYTGSISSLYVMPLVSGEGSNNGALESPRSLEMSERDQAMFGVLNQYLQQRKALFHKDRHLLLMTKWDAQFNTITDPELLDPQDSRITRLFEERYPRTWARYANLPVIDEGGRPKFSFYSAGMMHDSRVLATAVEDRPRLNFFPRKLLDWLWEGATGRALYPDVRPGKRTLISKMADWLRGKKSA